MSILSKVTVTPLLYACGALLLTCLALSIALKVEASTVTAANAERDTAQANTRTANTERDAWKGKAQGAVAANVAADQAIESLKAALQAQQTEQARTDAANASAIAHARSDARDADRTLKLFTAKFQSESRKPDCAHALAALEAQCPALQDY